MEETHETNAKVKYKLQINISNIFLENLSGLMKKEKLRLVKPPV